MYYINQNETDMQDMVMITKQNDIKYVAVEFIFIPFCYLHFLLGKVHSQEVCVTPLIYIYYCITTCCKRSHQKLKSTLRIAVRMRKKGVHSTNSVNERI